MVIDGEVRARKYNNMEYKNAQKAEILKYDTSH